MAGSKFQNQTLAPVQEKESNEGEKTDKSLAPPSFQLQAKTAGNQGTVQKKEKKSEVAEGPTEEVRDHLSLREGFRKQVYLDSLGLPTVGTGHLLTKEQKGKYPVGSTVPDTILQQWLIADSTKAYSKAHQMAIAIGVETQEMVNGLTAVNFQLGTAWNTIHKNTWKKLKSHDWEGAANEAADSKWFAQTPTRVLDFQKVLLKQAGKPYDYASLVEFNKAAIKKRNVKMPSQRGSDAWNPEEEEHSSSSSSSASGTASSGASAATAGAAAVKTATPKAEPKEDKGAGGAGLSGAVGLAKDGSKVGSAADIKIVQQQLIYAGLLPAEYQSKSGQMKSNADGFLGKKSIAAIKEFQATVMHWKNQDGRIDPGGKTWGKLSSYSGSATSSDTKQGDDAGGGTSTPVDAPKAEAKPADNVPASNTGQTDAKEEGGTSAGQVSGPSAVQTHTSFENIPATYGDKYKIAGKVGNGGANSANDQQKIKSLLNMAGYKTDLLVDSGTASEKRKKKLTQLKNCIYHFQLTNAGLGTDARVDPNGGTWKKMVEVAYMNSGGAPMSESALSELNNKRKGEKSDVPGDMKANITNGHLLGIDNSGYLLPTELHGNARSLKSALEAVKAEIGNFQISCGYRSPEHNVKIGSTASKSQHVQGIAADIQKTGTGLTQSQLKTKLKALMDAGKIPAGGLGLYSWGVHYDIRGSYTSW